MKINKPFYFGFSILDISKIAMYKYWNDYTKPECGDKAKICYSEKDSFM